MTARRHQDEREREEEENRFSSDRRDDNASFPSGPGPRYEDGTKQEPPPEDADQVKR